MSNVWCVRADFGTYTKQFIDGGYVAIGWLQKYDLSAISSKEELYPLYKEAHPEDTSNLVIGQQVGQIARFLLEIKPGDFVITPAADTEWLRYGEVLSNPPYIYAQGNDGCPYRQRKPVKWAEASLNRGQLSVPLQNTLGSSLTVFSISQQAEFFKSIGRTDLCPLSKRPITTHTALCWSKCCSSTIRSSRYW